MQQWVLKECRGRKIIDTLIIVSWLFALVLEFFMVGLQLTGSKLKQQLMNSRSKELLVFLSSCAKHWKWP